MSWSFCAIGRPAAIVAALVEHSDQLSGQSKLEFDDALPHLVGLVQQNFASDGGSPVQIEMQASGSGYALDGVQKHRTCDVSIKRNYQRILLDPPEPPAPAPSEPVNQEPATPPPPAPQSESDAPAPEQPATPAEPVAAAPAPVATAPEPAPPADAPPPATEATTTPAAELPGAWRGKF